MLFNANYYSPNYASIMCEGLGGGEREVSGDRRAMKRRRRTKRVACHGG